MQILSALVLSALVFVVKAAPPITDVTLTLEPSLPPTLPPTLPPPTTTRPTLTLDPTFTIDPTFTVIPTARTNECICPGKLLCCKALVDSEDAAAQDPLKELGVAIDGTHIPVGLGCKPYNPLAADILCRQPVCCFDAQKPEIAAIGCVKVPIIRPTPTITIPTLTVYPTIGPVDPTIGPVDPTIGPVKPSFQPAL